MIAVVSLPIDKVADLPGRPITPFGWEDSGRCYALDIRVPPLPPPLGLASVVWNDQTGLLIRWFADERTAILWAIRDALERGLA